MMFFGKGKEPQSVIGQEDIKKATEILQRYKSGKANLEKRIVDDELWWELRHWESVGKGKDVQKAAPSSAWLFNGLLNKHADAMDNYPLPVVLPRERSDEDSAKTLSSILPVIMEYNNFEDTYSSNWWEKLKHGTAAYGIFWNPDLENGLGDVDIKQIDLLNIFYEPGVTDIQKSKNLFVVQLVDKDILQQKYPDAKLGNVIEVEKYIYDDTVDTTDKVIVVDWYYKVNKDGRTILHYVKFCGDTLLFASENDPIYANGWYGHGMYPIVLDVMYPEKGTPIGFGYIAIAKDPQLYIDKLQGNILESSMMGTKKRFFISNSTGINEDEFLDWSRPLVHVEGEIGEERIKEIIPTPISPIYTNILDTKVAEMKETTGNRDVNSGGGSQVTAAAAIAALQEAGNKTSRDMISSSYRAYINIVKIVIELVRQFYDETRSFRITGDMPGDYRFVDVNNLGIKDQPMGTDSNGIELFRKPVFDLKIKAMKKSPFSRMEENERAKELYQLGFFDPNRAQEALGALEMMEFEGIDKVRDILNQGATLQNIVQQQAMVIQQMERALGMAQTPTPTPEGSSAPQSVGGGIGKAVTDAQTPMTSYGQALAQRSAPNMDIDTTKAALR